MNYYEQGYVAAMKTAGLWDTAKDLARLVGTGRSTLRHGTSSAAAKQIKAQGLIPQGSSGISELADLADHEKGLAFLTRGQGQARNYALQAEGIRDTQRALNAEDTVESLLGGGAVSSLYRRGVPEATRAQADKNVRRFLQDPQGRVTASRLYGMAPGFGGKGEVVRAEVPWHKLQKMEGTQVEPYRDNPAFMMLDAADDMFQEAYGKRLHLRATPFMDVVAVPGGVPASAIRGGDAFQRPTLLEVKEHFQNVARDPRGFAKEIARTATGLQHRPSTIMAKAPNAGQT